MVKVPRAYLTTGSRKGARTSPKTWAAYRLAVRDFVPWTYNHRVQLAYSALPLLPWPTP